jgi:hypothetical protein
VLNKYNNERNADTHNDTEMDLKGGVSRDTSLIALFLGFLTALRFSIVFMAYCLPALGVLGGQSKNGITIIYAP